MFKFVFYIILCALLFTPIFLLLRYLGFLENFDSVSYYLGLFFAFICDIIYTLIYKKE
jgi:hypothetical protein